jgi:hypothetical protein
MGKQEMYSKSCLKDLMVRDLLGDTIKKISVKQNVNWTENAQESIQ